MLYPMGNSKVANIMEMTRRRAKLIEIWNSQVPVDHISGNFEIKSKIHFFVCNAFSSKLQRCAILCNVIITRTSTVGKCGVSRSMDPLFYLTTVPCWIFEILRICILTDFCRFT